MKPFTEAEIRASLINAGPDVAAQMTMPGLHEILWDSRDYLGWHDTRAPRQAYMTYWRQTNDANGIGAVDASAISQGSHGSGTTGGSAAEAGRAGTPQHTTLTTILLRVPQSSARPDRLNICALCGTQQPASLVRLFTAPLTGESGRTGSTVGTYICDDFSCSLTIRNARPHDLQADFGGFIERRIDTLRTRLHGFVSNVFVD